MKSRRSLTEVIDHFRNCAQAEGYVFAVLSPPKLSPETGTELHR